MCDPEGIELGLHLGFAIAAIGGHRLGHLGRRARDDPGDGRHQHGGVGRVAHFHDDGRGRCRRCCRSPVPCTRTRPGLPSRPLAIGRASVSCRETTRVAPSGTSPCEAGAGLGHDLIEYPDGALELGDEGECLARGPLARTPQPAPGVCGHELGVFDGGLGDGGQLSGEGEYLVFGVAAAPAQPGGDLMRSTAHRTGAVPKPGPTGQTERAAARPRSW